NRGQGLVFKLGYWLARKRGAEVIATIDADGQYEPLELDRLVEPIISGRADFVNGSRRLGTELTTDPMRHAGVIFFGGVVSVLLRQRITDPACGIRAFRASLTGAITLEQRQYQTSEALIASAMSGFRVIEVARRCAIAPPAPRRRRRARTCSTGCDSPGRSCAPGAESAGQRAPGCAPRTPSTRRSRTSPRRARSSPRRKRRSRSAAGAHGDSGWTAPGRWSSRSRRMSPPAHRWRPRCSRLSGGRVDVPAAARPIGG